MHLQRAKYVVLQSWRPRVVCAAHGFSILRDGGEGEAKEVYVVIYLFTVQVGLQKFIL